MKLQIKIVFLTKKTQKISSMFPNYGTYNLRERERERDAIMAKLKS